MDSKTTLRNIIEMVVADRDSDELGEFVRQTFTLDMSTEEASEEFCDKFDLGDWFYEAMILNDIDIVSELDSIKLSRQVEEEEGREMREASEEVIRQTQALGW